VRSDARSKSEGEILCVSLLNPESLPNITGKERPMSKKKILVVDDTDFNRDLVVQLLEDEYDMVIAENGEEALQKSEAERPDLILMDLGMPVMDGWEATRKLKANDNLKHIPIIAVTSHAMVGDEIDARKAGCDDYLPKPIDEDLLIRKIRKYLG
jgi:two-component system, cell cycle response regulator DivK